jgi:hypothetical protein
VGVEPEIDDVPHAESADVGELLPGGPAGCRYPIIETTPWAALAASDLLRYFAAAVRRGCTRGLFDQCDIVMFLVFARAHARA